MNRIEAAFARARENRQSLLMPFVCAGHPAPDALPRLLPAMQRAGAAVVEVGIPFSDPIADGPTIAAAMHEALGLGASPRGVFDQVASVRDQLSIGLVAMVSVSVVYRVGGPDGFAEAAARAGFDGVIYPDVPVEESEPFLAPVRERGLTASLLVSPTSSAERARRIADACSGFVYLLARTGITGERGEAPDVSGRVAELRQSTRLPIACGFGISTPEHVRAVLQHADAAIVGSALVRRLSEAQRQGHDPVEAAELFTAELAAAAVRL